MCNSTCSVDGIFGGTLMFARTLRAISIVGRRQRLLCHQRAPCKTLIEANKQIQALELQVATLKSRELVDQKGLVETIANSYATVWFFQLAFGGFAFIGMCVASVF